MSRIGKQTIEIPNGVELTLNGDLIMVKGPKGELTQRKHPLVNVAQKDNLVQVTVSHPEEKMDRSLWGLFQRLISNMVMGVTKGYEKKLEINGVGFKALLQGNKLLLKVGFSHEVNFNIPEGIKIVVENNLITVSGIDKQLVGETAAQIRAIKAPEPYQGKGIKYVEEIIRRKEGKAAKAVGA